MVPGSRPATLRKSSLAVALTTLLSAAAVQAQVQDGAGPPATDPAAAKPASAASGSLEEVIVTARRREENIQETPIAVTAISGDALREQGITNTSELTKSVPSLQINKGQSNQIYIRGIGERTGFARVDPTVGVYLDDMFLPRADGQLLDTVDVQSIQVLRGPQGTLFGKNTTGGALVLTLAKPHDTFEGYVEGGIGNYGLYQGKVGVNLPITDSFYTRIAANVIKDDGFLEDIGNGDSYNSNDRQSIAVQTRWDASDSFTLDTLAFAGKVREKLAGINCDVANSDALFNRGLFVMWAGDTEPGNPTAYRDNCEANSRSKGNVGDLEANLGDNPNLEKHLDLYLLGVTAQWELDDDHSLKLVLGGRDEKEGPIATSDNDGGPENWSESYNIGDGDRYSYSAELQLSGSAFDSRLNYTAGLFGMQESSDEIFLLLTNLVGLDLETLGQLAAGQIPTEPAGSTPVVGILNGPLIHSDFSLDYTTLAAYLQASLDITDNLQFTAGLRYTEETREATLDIATPDPDVIAARITGPQITPSGVPVVFGPSAGGFHECLAPCTWALDPVRTVQNLFPDADGDGIPDFPIDFANVQRDAREETFTKLTPMASVSYNLPDDWLDGSFLDSTMVYATWSNGFKSGFFEPRLTDGLQRVEPEEVENREIGFKIDAFDRSVRFNVALYSMLFTDMQLIQVSTDSQQNLAVVFQNAGESSIEGGEMELFWLPSPQLLLTASYSNNNYKFTDYKHRDLLNHVVQNTVIEDRSDENFPASPEESAALGIQYTLDTSVGLFIPRVDVSYKSEVFFGLDRGSWEAAQRDGTGIADDYVLVDARLSWQNVEGDLTLAAYVKNATDERYVIGTASVGDSTGNYTQAYGDPRRYGIELRQTF